VKIFQRDPSSLFGGILDWMLIPLLLLWPISLLLTWLVAIGVANKPYDRVLERDLQTVEALLAEQHNISVPSFESMSKLLSQSNGANHSYVQIRNIDGKYLAGEEGLPMAPEEESFSISEVYFRDEEYRGEKVRVAQRWANARLKNIGLSGEKIDRPSLILLQVAESYERRSTLAQEIVKGVMLPQLAILPLGILVLWFALARGLQPLRRLEEQIRKRKPDDLSPLNQRLMPLEVTPLVASINDLLARLESSIEAKKRFLADAAHQLKTPLAGLRMQSELAQTERLSNTELKHTLKLIGLSSIRATRVVNQLLSLARADVGAQTMTKVRCDLGKLVEEVLQETWQMAHQKHIDLGYEQADAAKGKLHIEANPILIKEMVRNLLENAINYTPSELENPGVINLSVCLNAQDEQMVFSIEDSGPGISEADKELVFQPFYRTLGVASQTEGSGLGLSIVKEIADQHLAQVVLEDVHEGHQGTGAVRNKGLRVRVIFPLAKKQGSA
jgi:two-component system, OmpR family, sensor histidine kinase TctE